MSLSDPGIRANVLGLGVNALLMVLKFVYGSLAGSEALVADGFNSAGDILATAIAFGGYVYAKKPPDEDHHFGHGNAENVAGLIVGAMLLATGVFIMIEGLLSLTRGRYSSPELAAVWVALFTIVTKEGLYRYASRVGRKIRSAGIQASARDHRADVLVGFVVLAGVLGARTGVTWLDPMAAMVVGLWIAVMAIEPVRSNFDVLMDRAPVELRTKIADTALGVPDVLGVEQVRVHPLGADYHVTLEIQLAADTSLRRAHLKAHEVEERIRDGVEHVVGVQVHVNPREVPG